MNTIKIKLDSMQKIRSFNAIISKFPYDFDLEQGRYYIDAKSILGILSLDQSSPMLLHFKASDEDIAKVTDSICEYIAE